MLANADLHIHSPYSIATSPSMLPENLLAACTRKGIHVLGSGDALHPEWQRAWEPFLENDAGIVVVPSAEVEDARRVHHLVLAEDFAQFDTLRELLNQWSRAIRSNGRPHVALTGSEIAERVHEAGALIGPAHAFTPWTSLYAYYDRVADCYGQEPIDFLELGLSADSSYGAGIPDLSDILFLSNSDAHSPLPEKCGREFNRLLVQKRSVRSVLDCIRHGEIEMNAGFFPEEGKYNRTACVRCFTQYSLSEAAGHRWRCIHDGGMIKKGVYDRAQELSVGMPGPRPPYLHIVPLGQIIQTAEGASSPYTKKCQAIYQSLVFAFENEIEVLVAAPVAEIRSIHRGVGDAVDALRHGRVTLHPGGGGKYGTFTF